MDPRTQVCWEVPGGGGRRLVQLTRYFQKSCACCHPCNVAVPSCVLRRWIVALESCHVDYVGRTTGAVGTVAAVGSALQAANYRIATLESAAGATNTYCDNSVCLDGRHASTRRTLQLRWRAGASLCCPSAAVSPELRALMEKARTTADDRR